MTNGDLFRRYTDEELVELLYQHYLDFSDADKGGAPSVNWCDLQGGCEGKETSECTPELHKACILRWLKATAKEAGLNGDGALMVGVDLAEGPDRTVMMEAHDETSSH